MPTANTTTPNNIHPHANCQHYISQVSGVSRCQQSPTFQLPTLCPSPTLYYPGVSSLPPSNCHHYISQVSGVSRCQQSPTIQLPTLCPSPTTCTHYITQVSAVSHLPTANTMSLPYHLPTIYYPGVRITKPERLDQTLSEKHKVPDTTAFPGGQHTPCCIFLGRKCQFGTA